MTCKIWPCTLSLVCFVLTSCHSSDLNPVPSAWQLFMGRDEGQSYERPWIYRALVPAHWTRQEPSSTESIRDTTKSICEFYIRDEEQMIRLTVHTFPITKPNLRIPPQAQIARWKQQFEELDKVSALVLSEAHGGFSGLYFEGQGTLKGQMIKMMGWSMQLASSYERQLGLERHPLDRLKRADYTIKATGPPQLMDKHRENILDFAHSFELIDELPSPL